MQESRIEKWGYEAVLDYRMSEKFGLDWKKYSNARMQSFIHILTLTAEREERELKKTKKQYGTNPKTRLNNFAKR